MSLQITKTDDVFTLKGRLHGKQVFELNNFFLSKLKNGDELMISLSGLDDLDLSGALMFNALKEEARTANKSLRIFAGGNAKILGPFLMLDNDRIITAA